MSARNFYNAMTPGSSIRQEFGKGRSSYMTIEETDLGADWLVSQNKVPREGLLNEINEKGLLTYADFNFLFLLMSTPRILFLIIIVVQTKIPLLRTRLR